MKINREVVLAVLAATIAYGGVGCSGINSSHSVSPATFLLPGLMKTEPAVVDPINPLPTAAPAVQVAQVR